MVLDLVEGAQHKGTLVAVVLDHLELGQDPCGGGHYPAGPDQLVQVELSGTLGGAVWTIRWSCLEHVRSLIVSSHLQKQNDCSA